MTTIGFVGAGNLGGSMVSKLLSTGNEVHLFARRPEVSQKFAHLGANVYGSGAPVTSVT
jgi:3-hydroxyisobutyrate dehydrogenase-like beta-hydroxyacid dehydrogenase